MEEDFCYCHHDDADEYHACLDHVEQFEREIRCKAIDDFAETLIPRLTDAIYPKDVEGMRNLINDVAEQLKEGGVDEV